MLDDALKTQLKTHLAHLRQPIRLVAALDASDTTRELRALLEDIAGLSDLITLAEDGAGDVRRPSFAITREDGSLHLRFAGLPLGHEFGSLVLALLWAGGHPPREDAELLEQVRALEGDFHFRTFFSQSCQNCPEVVQALNLMAALNPRVRHEAIDGAAFAEEMEELGIMAVPVVQLNGTAFGDGRMSLAEILAKLDTGVAERAAARLSERPPYDVLVVGGGPAGAAAAIYAARKGISTGLVAERFGGQVLDTLAIENFISVPHTEGPQLAAALERHVREYEVDLVNLQRAEALVPGEEFHTLELASGARLRAKSVVLATGARWRQLGVPGEAQYRAKGVAYCPHCDGPLFKGKRVAVIGGGNSGVEAAIDLAGIVGHVTLLEFDPKLRADEVLQRKLRSLPNVDVLVSAQTTEILGDGARMTGLRYRDRNDGGEHELELAGVFIQIGLLPNTEWLEGTLALSPRGEIEIDARGATSVPGVFAAGDCTTVPYKQIVVAMGAGSTAALSAFDHLIRSSVALDQAA